MASKLSLFLAEFRRRKVGRVAVVYVLVGLGAIEAVDIIGSRLLFPQWAIQFVIVLVLVGFPIALVLAWALEVTPQGIQKTADLPPDELAGQMPEKWRASSWALAGVGLVVVLTSGYFVFFRGGSESSLPEDYVAVFPFQNLTGNPELDQFGSLAAFLVTDGLGWVPEVGEVASTTVLQAVEASAGDATLLEIAAGLGAGTAVTGAYSMSGGVLEVRAEVLRVATGERVRSEESSGSPLDPSLILDDLRQRIAGGFALHSVLEGVEHFFSRTPTIDALEVWGRGMGLFGAGDWDASLPHLYEAYRLDPTFHQALIWALAANLNLGRYATGDSLVKILEPLRGELSPRDRPWLDRYVASIRGDRAGALQAARSQAQQDPAAWSYSQANQALQVGRPQEALESLARVDLDQPHTRDWRPYWTRLAQANHYLGRYEEALDAAQRGRARFQNNLELFSLEVEALIAMGRLDEIGTLLERIREEEPDVAGWNPGFVFRRVAASLARFGHREESRQVAERALDWYQARDPEGYGNARVRTLLLADRPEDARSETSALIEETPQNLALHGLLGIALASTGDRERAAAEANWCEELDRPYLRGANTFWRAAILSHLDRLDEATRLLRQSLQEGVSVLTIRADPNLMPLWGHESFERLIAPKG